MKGFPASAAEISLNDRGSRRNSFLSWWNPSSKLPCSAHSCHNEQTLRSDEELSHILKGAENVHGMGDRMQSDLGNVQVTVNYADHIFMREAKG